MRPHLLSALCMLVTGIYAQSGNTGTDTGNTLCTGACTASAKELSCGQLGKPEASSHYFFFHLLTGKGKGFILTRLLSTVQGEQGLLPVLRI